MIRPQVRYCCETCGQPVDHAHVREPVEREGVVLVGQTIRCNAHVKRLTPSQSVVLRALMLQPRRSAEALIILLETDADTADQIVKNYIVRIRRALKAVGAVFTIRNIYGWGYELVPCRDA